MYLFIFGGWQCISGTDTWQRVNTGMPVKSPRFALFDLAEGKSYSFRVRCCNSAGVSEASVATEEITVGDKLGGTLYCLTQDRHNMTPAA